MLQLTNFKKTYGSTTILQIPDLQLEKGVYWLKGENGAGKTTFLKSVAGLIPFDGEIKVDEISLRKQRMLYTKTVSFAEAEPVYPGFLSGLDLIRFYNETKGNDGAIVKNISHNFGMQSYVKNKIGTYSSGMLKKLSLLLAFIGTPKLILLDEPFITLDAVAITTLRDLITSMSHASSFIISSHQPLEPGIPYHTLKVHQQTILQGNHVVPAK